MNPRKLLLALGVSCLLVPSTNAAFTATWNFTGQPGNQATTPVSLVDSVSPNIGVSDLGRTGLTGVATADTMSANGWAANTTDALNNTYFSFFVNGGTLQSFSLTSLSGTLFSTGGPPPSFQILSSVDSFGSPLDTVSLQSQNPGSFNIDLSSNPAFQNVIGNSIIEFRFAGTAMGSVTAGFQNSLVLTGTSTPVPLGPVNATPLPSGLLGVLVGVPMLAFLRRRFHKAV